MQIVNTQTPSVRVAVHDMNGNHHIRQRVVEDGKSTGVLCTHIPDSLTLPSSMSSDQLSPYVVQWGGLTSVLQDHLLPLLPLHLLFL